MTATIRRIYTINWRSTIHMTLKMTSAQVVETSVIVNNNSSFQNYTNPDDHTQQTTDRLKLVRIIINVCIIQMEVRGCKNFGIFRKKRTAHNNYVLVPMSKCLITCITQKRQIIPPDLFLPFSQHCFDSHNTFTCTVHHWSCDLLAYVLMSREGLLAVCLIKLNILIICSDEGLTLETSAFQSLYGGQFTLSTPLINQIFVFHSPTDAVPQFLQKLTPFKY